MVEIPTQMGTATQLGETLVWPSVNLKVISKDIIDRCCRGNVEPGARDFRFSIYSKSLRSRIFVKDDLVCRMASNSRGKDFLIRHFRISPAAFHTSIPYHTPRTSNPQPLPTAILMFFIHPYLERQFFSC